MSNELSPIARVEPLRQRLDAWRQEGQSIALVPTMGNLHAGHIALVARARQLADRVVATVFVNPTQFGPNEDFATYPRTLAADARALAQSGCDLLFAPDAEQMYPLGQASGFRVHAPATLSSVLCGAFRPGHFDGVATVVGKLFNLVAPDVAVFGRKDYQQLKVIEWLVRDFAWRIRIEGVETKREADGLAMSSRNQYLEGAERATAARIYQVLLEMRCAFERGQPEPEIEQAATEQLHGAGFRVDYAAIRDADTLAVAASRDRARVALVAARLGRTRLIDNLLI